MAFDTAHVPSGDWKTLLSRRAALVEAELEQTYTGDDVPPGLARVARYSLLAGGKRLRPVLCLACARACAPRGGAGLDRGVLPFAAGLEMIHTYSLIHDDLPAMDDDDLRRGRPTCHKAWGEAAAILAGDALLTDAFGRMAAAPLPPERVLEAVRLAARAAGAAGMAGGQMLDLNAEGHALSCAELVDLNARKTGALLAAACECGAVLAGADAARRAALRRFGEELGIAFQITDDILDVVGDEAEAGKNLRHDGRAAKATWPSLLGLDAARALAEEHCRAAEKAVEPALFDGQEADFLRLAARYLVSRTC
ncbi:MAG: polyprenyl synthetase family protein [Desulfovibrionaceae bacterium]|nr:polyprenyl synthetase family protein [Desulfovibrionaceae bacterium]